MNCANPLQGSGNSTRSRAKEPPAAALCRRRRKHDSQNYSNINLAKVRDFSLLLSVGSLALHYKCQLSACSSFYCSTREHVNLGGETFRQDPEAFNETETDGKLVLSQIRSGLISQLQIWIRRSMRAEPLCRSLCSPLASCRSDTSESGTFVFAIPFSFSVSFSRADTLRDGVDKTLDSRRTEEDEVENERREGNALCLLLPTAKLMMVFNLAQTRASGWR